VIPLYKYWEIAKIHMKTQLVWRVDVVFQMIFTICKILFAYLLWHMIFTGKDKVMGFSFAAMMSYYLISSFLSQLDMSQGISEEISQRIRNGTFSKYLILPIRVEGYFLAMELGMVLFYLVFVLAAGVVWVEIFQIHFLFTSSLFVVAGALLIIIEGMIFMVLLNFYFGLLTLKYQGIGTFLMIKNNLIALITGTLIPLALFPNEILLLMKLFPFYYITYLPSMLLIGYCENELMRGIFILLLWCIVLQIIIWHTWNRYRKAYDGVGI